MVEVILTVFFRCRYHFDDVRGSSGGSDCNVGVPVTIEVCIDVGFVVAGGEGNGDVAHIACHRVDEGPPEKSGDEDEQPYCSGMRGCVVSDVNV